MANIAILGSGSYGTALAKSFSDNNKVLIYAIDEKAISDINKYRENKRYLPGIKLNSNVKITNNLSEVSQSEIIVVCVPSTAYKIIAEKLRQYYRGQIIVSASKGITEEGYPLTSILREKLNIDDDKILALSGPSIAVEVAKCLPAYLILGGERKNTQIVKKAIESRTFLIRCSRDRDGIQYLGFYKNIIAILVGLCDGLELGNNFTAALVTKAYSEFYYLNQNKKIRRHSFIDFAGLGDLYVTATSNDSRNRRFGKLLAKKNSSQNLEDAMKEIGQVVEGYDNLLRLSKIDSHSWFDRNLVNTILAIIGADTEEEKKEILIKYLKSSEIKAIVFDWGYVLTKNYYTLDVAKKLSPVTNVEPGTLLKVLEATEKDLLLGKQSLTDYYKRLAKKYPKLSYRIIEETYKSSITWNEEMINYLKELSKNYDLYVLSNNYDILMPEIKKKLKGLFKGEIYSNEVHKLKPNDNMFNHLLEKYDLRAENCIFVDDCEQNILAAERNKFNVIKYDNLNNLKKEIHNIIIKN